MKSRKERIDSFLRAAVLACICVIVYAGPASVLGTARIYDEDIFGGTSGSELLIWVGGVWLFASPLVLAHKWWNTDPNRSMLALGTFLVMMLFVRTTLGNFGLWILTMALTAPFNIWSGSEQQLDVFYYITVVVASIVCIVVPTAAMVFQLTRRKASTKQSTAP